ncbi:MAG TPA: efflux RND transporter periplasmic adaptor subunit [Anaeromyxobacteraceae bacterium]|nr:efflux RND transporter periplasmic adaptor subunit [Anaeromyxobacteraceae bacterium]
MPLPAAPHRRAFLAVAIAAFAAACAKEEAPKAPPPPDIPVVQVGQRDTPIDYELVAQIRGYEDVEIRARVEGYLASIDYAEGSEVKKGQLLFTIDDQQYRAALAEARAALARAESQLAKTDMDVKRYTPLAAERAISQAELDNAVAANRSAKAQVEAANANLERARLDLSYSRMYSPIVGIAGHAEKKVGDLVGKGIPTVLTTVSSIDPIRVSVAIPEAEYLRFTKATAEGKREASTAPPRLVLSDGTVHPYPGKIIFVDRAVDPTTGTLRVDLAFPNPQKTLRPGLYGKLIAQSEVVKGALLVPQRAVQELQGTYTVLVVGEGNKVETRKVKPGAKVGTSWIIEDGLKPGDRVVVEGFQRLRDGVVVNPTAAPAAPPPGTSAPAGAPAEK